MTNLIKERHETFEKWVDGKLEEITTPVLREEFSSKYKFWSDWLVVHHATAAHAWDNGQKLGDDTLTLDREMYINSSGFLSNYHIPVTRPLKRDEPFNPIGLKILIQRRHLNGGNGGVEKSIPNGTKLHLMGNGNAETIYNNGKEITVPVFHYVVKEGKDLRKPSYIESIL